MDLSWQMGQGCGSQDGTRSRAALEGSFMKEEQGEKLWQSGLLQTWVWKPEPEEHQPLFSYGLTDPPSHWPTLMPLWPRAAEMRMDFVVWHHPIAWKGLSPHTISPQSKTQPIRALEQRKVSKQTLGLAHYSVIPLSSDISCCPLSRCCCSGGPLKAREGWDESSQLCEALHQERTIYPNTNLQSRGGK